MTVQVLTRSREPKGRLASSPNTQPQKVKEMTMFPRFLGVLLVCFVSAISNTGDAMAQVYSVTEKEIPVKLVRGDLAEYGRIVYRAWVDKYVHESGHPSRPLKGQFIDTRQCRWSVTAHMTRQYFVTSLLGKDDGQAVATVNIPIIVHGSSNGLANFLDHDPCNDYRDQIDRDFDKVRAIVVEQFDSKMKADIKAFKNETEGVTVIVNP